MAGLILDPWQEFILCHSLGERRDGKWAAFEVGVVVSRQNGKGSLLEARELAGLFLLDELLIIHSAHQFDTSLEAFNRLLAHIENNPEFDRRVKRVSRSHGEEGITLKTGQRVRFRTRTKGGGRGFTADCVILDEAMIMPESSHSALLPVVSAVPNAQVWYTGSAVDQEVHDHGVVFARVRERGMTGNDPSLAFFEWSIDTPLNRVTPEIANDPRSWAQANPALGIRISSEHVGHERASMLPRGFAVERLGVGDWPRTDGSDKPIPLGVWQKLNDPASAVTGRPCFAFDVAPDRSSAAIGVAGMGANDLEHVEVIDHHPGTEWVTARLAALVAPQRPLAVVCDASGPAGSLLADLAASKVKVTTVNASEHAQACGMFYDTVHQGGLRHGPQPELVEALDGATKRPLGDGGWAWSRKTSAVDISPLVAVTLAHWGSRRFAKKHARVIGPSDIERMRAERDARRAAEQDEGD